MTAELALALPGVVLILLLCLGAGMSAAQLVLLQDLAADAARLLSRGEDPSAVHSTVAGISGSRLETETQGDLICVTARAEATLGPWLHVPLAARSCALGGGR